MPLEIRPAAPADEAAVVALWHVCGLVAPYNDPVADFRRARGRAASDVLVGMDEVGLAGSVMVGHDGYRGWLYYAATRPDAQREGIGRRMIDAAEQWLQARDIAKMQLMVRETNTGVVPFYEKIGFERSPRIVMSKWLNTPR